jgi:hypothetical protein
VLSLKRASLLPVSSGVPAEATTPALLERHDPTTVAATMAKPAVVVRRPVGSQASFSEDAKLPKDLPVGKERSIECATTGFQNRTLPDSCWVNSQLKARVRLSLRIEVCPSWYCKGDFVIRPADQAKWRAKIDNRSIFLISSISIWRSLAFIQATPNIFADGSIMME